MTSTSPGLLRSDIRNWLGAPDPSINQNVASKKCQETTGSWFVHGSHFLQWRDRPNSLLWLHGFVGCGKTVLCSTVINNIHKYTTSLGKSVLAFYYFDFSNQIKAQASSCLRSIVLQLAQRLSNITALESLHRVYATSTPPTEELLEVLRHMLQSFQRAYIVVDALDECTDQEELFDFLKTVRSWNMESLCVLVTSRDEPNIRNALDPEGTQEVALQNPAVDEDIALLIAETLDKDARLQEWSDMFPEIKAKLTEGAKGMFRWVKCQFQTLYGCPNRAEVRRALNDLPENLDKCYERVLRRVPQRYCDYTLRVLQWLCIADKSVRADHIMAAFAANIGDNPCIDLDCRFNSSEKVLGLCPGFIIISSMTNYNTSTRKDTLVPCFQIAHYSVKEYLLSNRIPPPPDPISIFRVDRSLANLAMAKTYLVFALYSTALSFSLSDMVIWPDFFRKAKEEPQLTALAIDYLTRNDNDSSPNRDYLAAMAFASSEGLHSIMTWLVEHHRAEINISDALFRVCSSRHRSIKIVKFLVERGAAVNELQYDSDCARASTPLHAAAEEKDIALVQALVHLGADLRKKDSWFGETALLNAARSGCRSLQLIKLLWCEDSGSSLDSKNHNALYWFAAAPDDGPRTEEIVWWLIHHGVNPYHSNNHGYTALHRAAEKGNETAVRVLLTATRKFAGYDGCLTVYLQWMWTRPRLSTARQLFAVDPRPFGDFRNGGGALSSFLLAYDYQANKSPRFSRNRFCAQKIGAILLRHEQDQSYSKTEFYVQFFSVLLEEIQPDDCAIAKWLAMDLKERDPAVLGMELWRVAVGRLSDTSCCEEREADGQNYDGAVDENLRVIRTLFRKREVFGVDITQLHRFLHQETHGSWNVFHKAQKGLEWFAETLVREEPACVLAGLLENNNVGQLVFTCACKASE